MSSNHYNTALDTVTHAIDLFTGDRAATYGDPLPDFTRIGSVWAALLNIEHIPAHTVAAMLAGLKLVRSQISPNHRDNWIDLVAYGALGAEVQLRAQPSTQPKLRTAGRVHP